MYDSSLGRRAYLTPATGMQTAVCPTCGGLECFCRPRFYAGQLLTEETLNQLDRYITNKNRLHNRYLHGWGVVCGLEVFPHACDDQVIVKSGYALSPCGDDLVVCGDDVVPVCDLIRNCRDRDREGDCDPQRPYGGGNDCADVDQEWVLAICYEEKAQRGLKPLKDTSDSCSRCGGAVSSCGCGSHEKTMAARPARAAKSLRPSPTECEPGLVCEGYRYVVYRAPARKAQRKKHYLTGGMLAGRDKSPYVEEYGEISQRLYASLSTLENTIPNPPAHDATAAELYEWSRRLKDGLVELAGEEGVHDSEFAKALYAYVPAAPAEGQPANEYAREIDRRVTPLYASYIRRKLCSVLLSPCPDPAPSNCVPLATVTVGGGNTCRVKRVCVWDVRKIVLTAPALEYWLSALNILPALRQSLVGACCEQLPEGKGKIALPDRVVIRPEVLRARAAAVREEAAPGRAEAEVREESPRARARGTLDVQTLARSMLGFVDEQGRPLLDEADLADPLQALAGEILAPAFQSLASQGGVETGTEVAELRKQVDDLQKAVREQETRIDALTRRSKRNR